MSDSVISMFIQVNFPTYYDYFTFLKSFLVRPLENFWLFSYLYIFPIKKWGGPNRQRGVVCKLILIEVSGPNKMILRVKNPLTKLGTAEYLSKAER